MGPTWVVGVLEGLPVAGTPPNVRGQDDVPHLGQELGLRQVGVAELSGGAAVDVEDTGELFPWTDQGRAVEIRRGSIPCAAAAAFTPRTNPRRTNRGAPQSLTVILAT